jgi:hypothetical protein
MRSACGAFNSPNTTKLIKKQDGKIERRWECVWHLNLKRLVNRSPSNETVVWRACMNKSGILLVLAMGRQIGAQHPVCHADQQVLQRNSIAFTLCSLPERSGLSCSTSTFRITQGTVL